MDGTLVQILADLHVHANVRLRLEQENAELHTKMEILQKQVAELKKTLKEGACGGG